ncbi:hypothetical protein [uncultured Cytophaga sp.]|uniref:hypothetical protein n=1 Tax=uncultured Cytophaga sp. TaxID=160238 RepID=UPI00260C8B8F|nr:hypothetical protein [uncultured Cytophaga sp.]
MIYIGIKNSVWKESKGIADWVIVSDLYELIYHPDLVTFLTKSKKEYISISALKGCNMFSETYP